MITISELPLDILSLVVNQIHHSSSTEEYQHALTSLSQTCHYFNRIVNPVLYKNIVIYDNENAAITNSGSTTTTTFIHISHLPKFINSLSISNFKLISSIHIHCHSNFATFDYYQLYNKLNYFWSKTNHAIEFINFDVDNIRRFQCLNHFISHNNGANIVEENDEWWHGDSYPKSHHKLNNLKNWSILSIQELYNIPVNPNLTNLDFFIEGVKESCVANPTNLMHNLRFIKTLHLNTTPSTKIFTGLSNVHCDNLENLSVCYSHTFNQPKLTLSLLTDKVNFNNLHQLELKLNCFHPDCDCINQFYHDLALLPDEFTNLTKLSIINYKSKNSANNLCQYNYLVSKQLSPLFKKFSKIKSLYFNINEFLKIDQLKIDWNKFISAISTLTSLDSLTIVDFFNWWMPSIALPNRSVLSPEILLNSCGCSQCNQARYKFTKMAEYDAENNYTHKFSSFNHEEVRVDKYKVILNKSNSKFLTFIYQQFKSQFNQPLIYSLHANNFRENKELWKEFQLLFKHNCLNRLSGEIKHGEDYLKVNLGGIIA
ncbi:uncharacterized protein SPAPADRAFT_62914 [Spathaspora passalidarum NRRL Y-27907]|uniref:F-box domain-containing protein n=1 Tax=Spathaspora passalidarum (strain NRRL Y-27907 / 11-Y1) TaxID=619300 RepID=G3AS60_SPAPN|nr:uncharacterized protein SPAPADRAFT_62914 [Spathaspora passalidarum NRRL Y-27907]EGW31019.1 hypothetical protein SPAPADRAFT_62914 [Spathaspora passalidarum NRRL Y-27907]